MPFDLLITILESSPAAQVVQRVAAEEQITPEQAVTHILTTAASQQAEKSPAIKMLGAFSSDEDIEITDQAMKHVHAMRQTTQLRDFGV